MARKRMLTPPYVPRNGFRSVLDLIQSHRAGEVVARSELHKRGLSSHLSYPALAALHFLGLVDDEGRLTGEHKCFSRENPDREAKEAVVRRAYAKFFDQAALPARNVTELKQEFQRVYELSSRLINSAFPLFHYLAEDAGIALTAVSGAPSSKAASQGDVPVPAGEETPDEASGQVAGSSSVPARATLGGCQIVLNLQVGKYTTEKDIIKMVKTANRALHLLKKSGTLR